MQEVVINLGDNEVLVKKKASRYIATPNYFRVGNGTVNKSKVASINLLHEIMDSNKAEQFILRRIIDGIGYDNGYDPVVKIKRAELTSTQISYLKKGYGSLKARGLVKRVKRGSYMINPNALIPADYESALELWNSLD